MTRMDARQAGGELQPPASGCVPRRPAGFRSLPVPEGATRKSPAIRGGFALSLSDGLVGLTGRPPLRGIPALTGSDYGPGFLPGKTRRGIVVSGAGFAFIKPDSPRKNA